MTWARRAESASFHTCNAMKLLCLVLILPALLLAQTPDCASIPPSLWCAQTDIINQCGFEKICEKHKAATYNQKINITVLVEALCPDCQNFLVNHLYPVVYKNFGEFVNIQLVPFGNAKIQDDGTIKCQHGEEECSINKFESCFIDSMQEQSALPAITCIEEGLKAKVPFVDAAQQCFDKLQIGQDVQRLTQSCLVSKLGAQLQAEAGKVTDSVWPEKHKFVPWVIFNGVSLTKLQGFQNQIPTLLCEWYTGAKPIPYCEASLKLKFRQASYRYIN
ncbi:unnamed protein product [Caenorhabditis bovis]|uniref:Saposin A-type domain-containing protein n=1 Tax=Caenorhabditis bovis TaxID=2654633 RepID=A0A8S1ES33_9PELO|nr:unnamed protein product [Caenorhabditis bovis]